MSNSFSVHEFFIEDGTAFRVEIEPHEYYRGDDALEEAKPKNKRENARLQISYGENEAEVQVSMPKDVLKQVIQIAQKYLKDGKGKEYEKTGRFFLEEKGRHGKTSNR